MREVAILGVGQTPVREHWDLSVRDLAVVAGRAAMEDAGIETVDAIYIGNMTSGSLNQQRQIGALVADFLGQWGVEAVKMEAACGSAGSAMRQGILAVASGEKDAVLAIGVLTCTVISLNGSDRAKRMVSSMVFSVSTACPIIKNPFGLIPS